MAILQQNILRLQVSVDYLRIVHVGKTVQDLLGPPFDVS